MRIVNFKKFIRSIIVILFIIFCLSIIFSKSVLSFKEIEYTSIYVAEGDTLWTIASNLQNNNDYYKNKDIRYIISDIREINHLDSCNIFVNQELLIPVIWCYCIGDNRLWLSSFSLQ